LQYIESDAFADSLNPAMEKLLNALKAKAEQFTPSEIEAEILRQRLRELEQSSKQNPKEPQRFDEISLLKLRLAEVEELAEYNSQGRTLARKYWKMMDEWGETREFSPRNPDEFNEMIEKYRQWLEKGEVRRTDYDLRQMNWIRRYWPRSDWSVRGFMIKRAGKHFAKRYMLEKPRYHLGRVLLKWTKVKGRRGP